MKTTIECTPAELADICREAEQSPPYFGVAAELGLCFRGGFDYAEVARNGWGVSLHDCGMNGKSHDFTFRVPVAARTPGKGPAN